MGEGFWLPRARRLFGAALQALGVLPVSPCSDAACVLPQHRRRAIMHQLTLLCISSCPLLPRSASSALR